MVCTSSLKQLTWASQLEPNMNEFSDGCHTPHRLQTFLLMVINVVILACLFLSSKAYNSSPQHCPCHWSSRGKVQGLSSKSAAKAPHIPRQPICHAFCSAFLPKQNCSREHGKEFSQEARHLVQYFVFQGLLIAPPPVRLGDLNQIITLLCLTIPCGRSSAFRNSSASSPIMGLLDERS